MIIFFDFDDTLFDRDKFFSALAESMGLSRGEFLYSYNQHFKDKNKPYSWEQHLHILGREDKRKEVEGLLEDLSDFVYPESYSSLRHFRDRAEQMILLSYGDEGFQSKKIQASGVAGYFDKIIITQDKVEVLKDWYSKEERIVFINDKQEENKKIKEYFPDIEILKFSF